MNEHDIATQTSVWRYDLDGNNENLNKFNKLEFIPFLLDNQQPNAHHSYNYDNVSVEGAQHISMLKCKLNSVNRKLIWNFIFIYPLLPT